MPCVRFLISLFLFVLAADPVETHAQHRFPERYEPMRAYHGQRLTDLPETPEAEMDVGLWALIVARAFDPSIDIESGLARLDQMAAEIRRMRAGRTGDLDALLAVRTYLYEPGPWNDHRPYTYDLDDPLGDHLPNQLLSTYLKTRRGNCVSMPTLVLALLERLDPSLPARGIVVPRHLLVRVTDRQTGDVWNVETTDEGRPVRGRYLIDRFDIPPEAVRKGAYLRELTKKEYVAALINVLALKGRFAGHYAEALQWAELIVELDPMSITGLVQRGSLRAWVAHQAVEAAKAQYGEAVPEAQWQRLRELDRQAGGDIAAARALGWREESKAERAAYLRRVEEEKARRAAGGRR